MTWPLVCTLRLIDDLALSLYWDTTRSWGGSECGGWIEMGPQGTDALPDLGRGSATSRGRLMTWPLVCTLRWIDDLTPSLHSVTLSLHSWYIEVTRGSYEVVTSSPVRCVAKLRWLSLGNGRFHQRGWACWQPRAQRSYPNDSCGSQGTLRRQPNRSRRAVQPASEHAAHGHSHRTGR